jgi:hypothetical protein
MQHSRLWGEYRGNNGIKPRRKMSAKGRARIAAAQRARWAKANGQQKSRSDCEAQTSNVNLCSPQDRSSTTCGMAKVKREKKAA